MEWMEWDGDFRERHGKPRNRVKTLVDARARRIARHPWKSGQLQHLLSPANNATALWYCEAQLALNDAKRALLLSLTRLTLETKHQVCIHGYLSAVQRSDPDLYLSTL